MDDDFEQHETTGLLSTDKNNPDITIKRRFCIENNSGEHSLNMMVIIEDLRAVFYISYIFMILLGFVLTTAFIDRDISVILSKVFGVSNLCSFIDFPPTTYFVPVIWCIPFTFLFLYTAAAIFRIHIAYLEKKLSKCASILLVVAHVYVFLSAAVFTIVFSVQPDPAVPVTMLVHTGPYANMKIAFGVLQVAIAYFGVKVSWKGLNLPRWFHIGSVAHAVVIIIVEVAGVVFVVNALADMGKNLEGKGYWWSVKTKANIYTSQWFGNYLASICHLLLPLIQALFICKKGAKSHALIIAVSDNRVSACTS